MATVYRAHDRRLGRDVALKVIHRHLRENTEVKNRFAGEALAVAKVKHPNIVEVYDVSGEDEEERYLVVELVEGSTLRQLLAEHSPLPAEIAACLAVEVTRALAQAHRQGVVHRDVKPENVLIRLGDLLAESESGNAVRVKLTDFGIAKLLDAQGVTCTGQVLGSPAHMAPEQIEGGEVDGRADVFGVGVLLYEMLSGVLPFEGKNPAQVLRRVLEGSFVPVERARPEVGSRYGQIVSRALAHHPADRFPTATEMGEALEAELARLGVTDVREEIEKFLLDPKAYIEEHRRKIPDRLAECAAQSRKQGDVVLSASDFNRALAYRPDDTVLLAEVAGIARRGRYRKRLRHLAVGGLSLTCAVGLLLGVLHLAKKRWAAQQEAPLVNAPGPEPEPEPKPSETAPEVAEPSFPAEEVVPQPESKPSRSTTKRPVLAKPDREVLPGTRKVRTPVVGPQNARVKIDGKLSPWFATHELTLGPHTFEFVPPNSECCEAPPARVVEIIEGEGPQVVRGEIALRPAVLRLSAAPGTKASCGVGGVLGANESRVIPMDRPERQLVCTILPPPEAAAEPKRVEVDLRPGRTFTLTGS